MSNEGFHFCKSEPLYELPWHICFYQLNIYLSFHRKKSKIDTVKGVLLGWHITATEILITQKKIYGRFTKYRDYIVTKMEDISSS